MRTIDKHPRIGLRKSLFYIVAAVVVITIAATAGDLIGSFIAEKRHGL